MATTNHDPIYESPSGYGENINKKVIKIDTRQSNIEKIRVRKTKVSFGIKRQRCIVNCVFDYKSLDLPASTKSKTSKNRNVLKLQSANVLL